MGGTPAGVALGRAPPGAPVDREPAPTRRAEPGPDPVRYLEEVDRRAGRRGGRAVPGARPRGGGDPARAARAGRRPARAGHPRALGDRALAVRERGRPRPAPRAGAGAARLRRVRPGLAGGRAGRVLVPLDGSALRRGGAGRRGGPGRHDAGAPCCCGRWSPGLATGTAYATGHPSAYWPRPRPWRRPAATWSPWPAACGSGAPRRTWRRPRARGGGHHQRRLGAGRRADRHGHPRALATPGRWPAGAGQRGHHDAAPGRRPPPADAPRRGRPAGVGSGTGSPAPGWWWPPAGARRLRPRRTAVAPPASAGAAAGRGAPRRGRGPGAGRGELPHPRRWPGARLRWGRDGRPRREQGVEHLQQRVPPPAEAHEQPRPERPQGLQLSLSHRGMVPPRRPPALAQRASSATGSKGQGAFGYLRPGAVPRRPDRGARRVRLEHG